MRLDSLFPPGDLDAAIAAGHVSRRTHPDLPLSIYTYTRACQYEQAWTPVTVHCRGLIVDDRTGDVAAWPFPKFFNTGEHDLGRPYAPPLPDEPFEVYDKVDGSLGIVFHYAGRWHAASKGSFTSGQATWAQAWLNDADTTRLWPGTTYLAEIVYPANRIVVDYGQRTDLVLLGAYTLDGTELPLEAAGMDWRGVGSVVRTWPALPLPDLLKLAAANSRPDGQAVSGMAAEGYVLRFASGVRAKAKLAEYVRLHKVLTGISERDIWRYLGVRRFAGLPVKQVAQALGCPAADLGASGVGGDPLGALLEQVPDEFDAWVRGVVARLERDAAAVEAAAAAEFQRLTLLHGDRAAFARAAQGVDRAVRPCLFLLLDGRPISLHVWRSIRPAAAVPFLNDDE